MIKVISYKKSRLSILFTTITFFVLSLPLICYGAEYSMTVDPSPNIINIESQRLGEIRIFTDVRYSTYISNGDSVFVYFNDGEQSVENIRTTRDSWGNLILKFDLEDLLNLEDDLITDAYNSVSVVVVMNDGDYYSGESEVYIADKKAQ